MSDLYLFKAGDSYFETCQLCESDDITPIPLTGYEIASSVMDAAGSLYVLTVTINPDQINNPGMYTLVNTNTSGWAFGTAKRDIKYIVGGLVSHTDTDYFQIGEVVTP